MELNKEQTYLLLYKRNKRKFSNNPFKFVTKCKWKCLSCGTTIYVSYKQYGANAIFCKTCFNSNPEPTVVQLHYMRKLKEYQLQLIEDLNKQTPIIL